MCLANIMKWLTDVEVTSKEKVGPYETQCTKNIIGLHLIDNDNDVYFTLATSDSRIGKYKRENKKT